jgi:trk system potassium uptake protein TrkH
MLACLPIVAVENVSFVDAYFNTVSATTTTGLTIEPDLGNYSYSSIFWLLFLGWIGGVGIIVLAFLGVFFSYNKFRLLANAEGHDEKFKSNIKSTILSIWIIYSIATLIGIIALRLCGLPLFDAICYAFTAISTTGTDINSVGLLGYGSIWALIVTLIIGLFGSLSFITHYLFFVRRKFKAYMEDPEFLTMFSVFFLVIAFVSLKYMKLVPFSDLYHIISAGTGELLYILQMLLKLGLIF